MADEISTGTFSTTLHALFGKELDNLFKCSYSHTHTHTPSVTKVFCSKILLDRIQCTNPENHQQKHSVNDKYDL